MLHNDRHRYFFSLSCLKCFLDSQLEGGFMQEDWRQTRDVNTHRYVCRILLKLKILRREWLMCTHNKPRSSTFFKDFEKKYSMPLVFIQFSILIKARLQDVKLSILRLIFYQFEYGYECKKRYDPCHYSIIW